MLLPIIVNKLGGKDRQRAVLGPLYDERYPWPVGNNDSIDMRLFSRKDLIGFVEGKDDPLRPAARKLSEDIASSNLSIVHCFVALSGSGKTSCAFDVAREH